MDIVAYVRLLPRELQYHILRGVGWHHGSPHELRRKVLWRRQAHVVGTSWCPTREMFRYSIPKWCRRCGEARNGRTTPAGRLGMLVRNVELKCPACDLTDYKLIFWGHLTI